MPSDLAVGRKGPMHSGLLKTPDAHAPVGPRNLLPERVLKVIISILIGFFLLFRLDQYPTITGWDEGMYLQFASNWAYYGEYATQNGNHFDRLIPPGGTGPTLIAPVGMALRLSNNSLTAARLVISLYFMAALGGVHLLLRNIRNDTAALVAIPLLLVAGYQSYDILWAGRQVLAELPALAFMIFALYAWHRGLREGAFRWVLLSALLLGLAVITKNQLIWALAGFFALVVAADWLYYRQMTWLQRLAPLAGLVLGYGLWFVISLLMIEPDRRSAYLQMQQALANASFINPSLGRTWQNVRFLLKSGQAPVAGLAIVYGLYRSCSRTSDGLARLSLPLLAAVLLVNFLVLSISWARYLLFPLAFCALCAAMTFEEILGLARSRWNLSQTVYSALVVLVVAFLAGPRLIGNAQRIVSTHNNDAQTFAVTLDKQLPTDARILNWEWEISLYSNRAFIRPSPLVFSAKINQVYNNTDSLLLDQSQIPGDVEYFVDGPFTHSIQLFARDIEHSANHLVFSHGPYSLFAID